MKGGESSAAHPVYSTSTRASSDAILSELQEEERRKTAHQLTAALESSCLRQTGGFHVAAVRVQANGELSGEERST